MGIRSSSSSRHGASVRILGRNDARACGRGSVLVDVVAFRSEHAIAFDRLNRDWLERFGLLEPPDETELTAPEQAFLQTGGAIFVAEEAGVVVGVCAMRPWSPDSDEVVKLAGPRRCTDEASAVCSSSSASRNPGGRPGGRWC